jgi:hypothetical protein
MDNFSEPEVPQVTCEDVKKAIDEKKLHLTGCQN